MYILLEFLSALLTNPWNLDKIKLIMKQEGINSDWTAVNKIKR